MEIPLLLKGAILGFCIAAPVGPIGLLCIQRTVHYGRFSGLASGLGAAFADAIYGIVAAFGMTIISDFLIEEQFWLRVFGGGFLLYLGFKTFLSKTYEKNQAVTHKTLLADFCSTFFLTLTNPMTILSYIAIFSGLGLAISQENFSEGVHLVLGVFFGSAFWWLILSEGITAFRKKLSHSLLIWINRIAGLLIIAFGLAAWICSIWHCY